MFKTKNGNNKITLEEFKERLKEFNPVVDKRTAQILYVELDHWLIGKITKMDPSWDSYQRAMMFIKKEFRQNWIALHISLSYDAPADSLVPQDMPYITALMDTTDGTIYSTDWISRYIWEKKNLA